MTAEATLAVDPPPTHKTTDALKYLFWTSVGVGILCVLFVTSGLTLSDLVAILRTVPLWVYVPLAMLQAAILILASLKWRIVLAQFSETGDTLPFRDALAGTSLNELGVHRAAITSLVHGTLCWRAPIRHLVVDQNVFSEL